MVVKASSSLLIFGMFLSGHVVHILAIFEPVILIGWTEERDVNTDPLSLLWVKNHRTTARQFFPTIRPPIVLQSEAL